MQIKLIFALIITLSGNFVVLGQNKNTKDESVAVSSAQNTTNTHAEKSNNTVHPKNSKLTGIPQVDYVHDPNLPRELRGYNLSSYPFFSSVPPEEDIHFKCDGLHDGFYASIEHKCQIYHHCVYGIRHDFLCANFTAFDQKTFICHFASDVDCDGSKKYWNRNDALYMPTTTTTTTTTTTEPPPTVYRRPVRPQRPLRRPLKRRPVNDYYYDEEYQDEYYEEQDNRRPIGNRQRPRKPIVEYDYEEETAPRRPVGNRYRFRVKNEELEDDYQESQTSVKQYKTSNKGDKNNAHAGERERSIYRKDKHHAVEDTGPQANTDISRRFSVRRRINEKRPNPVNTNEQTEESVSDTKPRNIPSTPEEYVTPKTSNPTIYGQPRAPPRIGRPVPVNEKKKFEYPVQKAVATSAPNAQEEYTDDVEEYYDNNGDYDYANERVVSAPKNVAHRHHKEPIDTLDDYDTPVVTHPRKRFRNETPYKHERVRKNKKNVPPVYADYEDEPPAPVRKVPLRPNNSRSQNQHKNVAEDVPLKRKSIHRKAVIEDEQDQEQEPKEEEEEVSAERETKISSNTSAKKKADLDVAPREKHIASVRVMKRPFLPSRGGSPYLPRGLQLVGVGNKKKELNSIRALPKQNLRNKQQQQQQPQQQQEELEEDVEEGEELAEKQKNLEDVFYAKEKKATAQNYFQNIEKHELQTSQSENAQHTLDLFYEHDYDVTINDALNPTLTPISSQSLSHQLHRN